MHAWHHALWLPAHVRLALTHRMRVSHAGVRLHIGVDWILLRHGHYAGYCTNSFL